MVFNEIENMILNKILFKQYMIDYYCIFFRKELGKHLFIIKFTFQVIGSLELKLFKGFNVIMSTQKNPIKLEIKFN